MGDIAVSLDSMCRLNTRARAPRGQGLFAVAACALSLVAADASAAHGQVTGGRTSCQRCSISVDHTVVLGSESDPVLIHEFATLDQDSKGRYYVGRTYDPGVMAVFDSRGRFLRSLGRVGRGPGEFQNFDRIRVGPRDSVFVIDNRSGRYSVIGPTGTFVRATRLPSITSDLIPLPNGDVLMTGSIASSERIGYPLHTLTTSGSIVRSFGTDVRSHPTHSSSLAERVIAPSRQHPAAVWVAPRNRHRVELWDVSGRRLSAVEPHVDWFPPWDRENAGRPDLERPQPTIVAVHEGGDGILWALSTVADRHWKASPDAAAGERQPLRTLYFEMPKYLDYVLEAMDVRSGKVLASRTFTDRMLAGFVRGAHDVRVFGKRQDDASGIIVIDVWNVSLVQ